MEALFLRVVWISLTCSAVLVPLLVGKGWLRQHVRAKALYVVWLILALRLVIPVDLSLPEPAVTVEAPSYQVALPARTLSANLPAGAQIEEPSAVAGQTAPEAASAVRTIPVTALLSALWLFGVLAAALVQGGGYLLARRRLLRDARPDLEAEEQAGQTAAGLGLKRAVPVRRSGQVRTPMVLGLIRPVLLLPEGQAVDEVVLCHELTHLKRLDLAYKALLVAACWLHWFNPLVWWMSRAASENLELCCDDDVAAGRDAAFRRKYGELLLSTAEEKPGPALSSRFGGNNQAMRDRLANLFVQKKRGRLLASTALAGLILVGGLVACEGRPAMTDAEALEALEASLSYDGEQVSFTIPQGDREWNIQIYGRAETEELGGISLHYLEGVDFAPGETYSFELSAAQARDVTALTIEVTLESGAMAGISISALVREPVSYVNREYGFTLTLPDGWADQVEIREGERGLVSFYMRDAGDFEDAGWLAGIFQCTAAVWNNRAWSNYPEGVQFLSNLDQMTFYASFATDLPVDPEIPGALDRYATLSGQVSELLDSFALADGGAYAVAQIWLEEQVADGMPGVADYPCLEGRVESVSYAGLYGAYEVYSFDYSLYTDRPDLVEEERSVDVGSDGWVSRPYSVSGLAAYLLLEGDEVVSVVYSDSSPLLPGFWYTCGAIPQEERYELAARVAYDQAYSLEQLYLGSPPWDQERVFTREELEEAGYAAETLPGGSWQRAAVDPWITQEEYLRNTFRSSFSDRLAQSRMDAMFSGPDAPYFFCEEELYFRNDVPCGPGYDSYTVDWDSFAVTRTVDQGDFQVFEFTLSGQRTRTDGTVEEGTWTFLLREDPAAPQYFMGFDTWFGET